MDAPILRKPVDKKYKIIQEFGFDNTGHPRRHNFYNHFGKKHPGVDFQLPIKTEVRATFKGRVVRREHHPGMGLVIGIRNENILALYAHLSSFKVNWFQNVTEGDLVGLSGDTGMLGSAPHLHFELRDIAKKDLGSMVFKPDFKKPIKQWKELDWTSLVKILVLQFIDNARSLIKGRMRFE